jgi:hypothetical protein
VRPMRDLTGCPPGLILDAVMRVHGWRRHGAGLLAAIGLAMLAPAGAGAIVFSSTGETAYDVPVGAGSLTVVATGAPGGAGDSGAAGGHGSTVRTTLPVTAGEVIYVDLGIPGANAMGGTGGTPPTGPYTGGGAGGGSMPAGTTNAAGGAGGGASALRSCSLAAFLCFLGQPPLVIAAGGGGGGGGTNAGAGGAGDAAGHAGAGTGSAEATPGGAGQTDQGGAKGSFGGTDGTLVVGGPGAEGSTFGGDVYDGAGGGGGGGMFGGGGGGESSGFGGQLGGAGGGGGSSDVSSTATGTTITTDTTGVPQITLTPIPTAPGCAGNTLNTLPGGSTITVVLPCTTPLGLPITYAVGGAPRHGKLGSINQTAGTVTYTPAAGFAGSDSFTFTATNSGGTSSTATATITVPAGNQAPPGGHCLVPKLKGSSLSAATRLLTAAGCALGKVVKPKTRKHRRAPKKLVVVSQGAAPGTELGLHSKVAVTLGVAAKRKAAR